MGWEVDVLVNRVVGIRKLLQSGRSALSRYRIGNENGLRVVRSAYLKIPGNEKLNITRWSGRTLKLYEKYRNEFGEPDLILAHSVTWAGYAASLIKQRYGVPFVVIEHRSFFVWRTENARRMVKPFYIPFFEMAYRECSKLVIVSQGLLKGLKSLMPWIEEKIVVIPNMIREDMFLPPAETRKTDPFVFLWAGRLEHVKGIDLLLEAVKILKMRSKTPFSVRLAGKGSLRSELEQQAGSLGITDCVVFLGRLSRKSMQLEMQGANCFVLPTRYEAFGAVLIEAMATGLPVIATRSGGPEHIVNSENGILIDPDNIDQLADAMDQMRSNHENYSADKIRTSTLDLYGATRVMERTNQLFRQILSPQKDTK